MQDHHDRQLLDVLERIGGSVSSRELAYQTGMPPGVVHERLVALAQAGMLEVASWTTSEQSRLDLAHAERNHAPRRLPRLDLLHGGSDEPEHSFAPLGIRERLFRNGHNGTASRGVCAGVRPHARTRVGGALLVVAAVAVLARRRITR